MKEVAILLLVALMLGGCGSNPTPTQTAQTSAGGTWESQMLGGTGDTSGYSFVTQFTVNSSGSLNVSYLQFLNLQKNYGNCFPAGGGTVSGSMILTAGASNAVTGTLTFTVESSGNTLTLNGAVTGTQNGTTLTDGSVAGTWTLTGGTGCEDSSGSFTMTQST
jgi:uncharacterized protein YceK